MNIILIAALFIAAVVGAAVGILCAELFFQALLLGIEKIMAWRRRINDLRTQRRGR